MNDYKQRFKILMEQAAGERKGFQDFMEWMNESDFYESPASTKYHGSEPGGLLKHSLNVYDRMKIRAAEYVMKGGTPESTVIVPLLHDICKVGTYRKTETGYEYRNNVLLPIGHGERSVIMIEHYMTLTREEIVAIRWHMGAYDKAARGGSRELSEAFRRFPLALMLHLADMEAMYLDE